MRWVFVLALIGLAPSVANGQSGQPLDVAATRSLASGNTWVVRGSAITVFNSSDGERILVRGNQAAPERGGRWWIDSSGKFCSSIPSVRKGQETCDQITSLGNDVYLMIGIEFTVEQGDSRKVKN